MGRELLFRGQMRRKGQKVTFGGAPLPSIWKEGGVFQGIGDFSIIYTEDGKYPVYSDTLSQYVGRTDVHEKKIFEGDIVKFKFRSVEYVGIVEWSNATGTYIINHFKRLIWVALYEIADAEIEVIGNVWDDPALAACLKDWQYGR